jgi:hypothetical protein
VYYPNSQVVFIYLFLLLGTEHFDPINVKIAELREALESIITEQKYLKARDTRHRHSKLFSLASDHGIHVYIYQTHAS